VTTRWRDLLRGPLAAWRGHRSATAPAVERWIVLDVETSGLDLRQDRLISIAAVGLKVDWPLRQLSIIPADSFEAVLRQEQPSSTQNILLHGIGVARQRNASEPQHALEHFVRFAGHAPLLAFHAAFDQGMLVRSIREQLHQTLPNEWVDIEHLCAVTHEQVNARSLDDWMTHFAVTCLARHQASADAFAAAELMCRIWPRVAHQCGSWRQVRALAMHHRWVRR
jgi:DNA polymerase-3 subunit epsilon